MYKKIGIVVFWYPGGSIGLDENFDDERNRNHEWNPHRSFGFGLSETWYINDTTFDVLCIVQLHHGQDTCVVCLVCWSPKWLFQVPPFYGDMDGLGRWLHYKVSTLIFFQPFNDGLDGIGVGHCIAHGKTFPSYTQCFFLVLFLRHGFRPPVSVVFVGFVPLTF